MDPDPGPCLMDPDPDSDPAIFVIDVQDKKVFSKTKNQKEVTKQ
jgi:hypothetical protein